MDSSDSTMEAAAQAVAGFFGLRPLTTADLGHLAAAAVIVAAILVVARLAGRGLSTWLRRGVAAKLELAGHPAPIAGRHLAGAITGVVALILLYLAAAGYPWPPYSELLFDVIIPLAAAVAAWRLAAAFNLSASLAMALATVCAFGALSQRYEQLNRMGGSLDGFALTLGEVRVSILDLLSYAFAGIVLYALVRIADHGAKVFIRGRKNLDVTQSLLAEKLSTIGIAVVAIFLAIEMLGIDTTALSVFSGTVGLGLGFGLQKIFSNLVSGIILLMDRSIKPGDVIVVGESVGVVKRIGTRAVSMITRDGKEHLIPNELLMTERVENWNFSSHEVRIRMSLRVAYDSDMDLVERLLQEATRESPRVLDSPVAAVRITDFGDAGIQLELRFWIRDPEDGLGNVQSEIFRKVLAKFGAHGIRMPNPGREVEITRAPDIAVQCPQQAEGNRDR